MSLESLKAVRDFIWMGDSADPPLGDSEQILQALPYLQGQFALAVESPGGQVLLARDRFGINKLFYWVSDVGVIRAGNSIRGLLDSGARFEQIHSVPAGHSITIDPGAQTLRTERYYCLQVQPEEADLPSLAARIRTALETWFARIGERFRDREICLCLSGGLDSSLVAALAKQHFPHLSAFTYSFVGADGSLSEDARYASRVAEHLRIPMELVKATAEDLLDAVEPALIHGQDWRDFNVHCAIVNELLARHIAKRHGGLSAGRRPLVLTGDMMNEIVADYTPISSGGVEYYRLPRLSFDALRVTLIRGLDSGDREIGVFAAYGLDAIQPYGFLVDEYMKIPASLLARDAAKQQLVQAVAGDLLPEFVLGRTKVRAQAGSEQPVGILPVLAEAGQDTAWLKEEWMRLHEVGSIRLANRFIQNGVYRTANDYPANAA